MPDIQHSQIEPDIEVVAVSGQILLGRECQKVEWAIDGLLREGKTKVVFDLKDLTHIDSTGLGILLTCCGRVTEAGGELRLAALQPRIVEVMRIAKIDRILTFYPSAQAAAENFTSAAG
jgi:anti-sigma B factor antagonist